MFVGKDDQVVKALQVRIEGVAETFLKLVRASAQLRLRLGERLHREYVELRLLRVVHRGTHRRRGEVLARDDDRPNLHAVEEALPVARGEVRDRLLEDGPPRRDDREVADAVAREVLHRPGKDVRLPDPGGHIDDGLEGRRLTVDLKVLADLEDDALERFLVRLA